MVPLTHEQILAFVHGGGLKIFGLTHYEFDTLILPSVYSDILLLSVIANH